MYIIQRIWNGWMNICISSRFYAFRYAFYTILYASPADAQLTVWQDFAKLTFYEVLIRRPSFSTAGSAYFWPNQICYHAPAAFTRLFAYAAGRSIPDKPFPARWDSHRQKQPVTS